MSWPGAMLTAPAGQPMSSDGPGLEMRPAGPVPLPVAGAATVVVVGPTEVVVAWRVVAVVVVGLGFLGLRVASGRANAPELIRAPVCSRLAPTSAPAHGRSASIATTATRRIV